MTDQRPSTPALSKRQQGTTMIELMITLVVVSVGLLSVAALQIKTTQFSQTSFQRSITIVQASDLVERLWAGACDLPDNQTQIRDEWIADHSTWIANDWDDLSIEEEDGELQVTITIPFTDRENGDAAANLVHETTLPMLSCS